MKTLWPDIMPTVIWCVFQAYVFKEEKVREVVRNTIKAQMEGHQYDPVKGSKVSSSIHSLASQRESLPFMPHLIGAGVNLLACAASQAAGRGSAAEHKLPWV